MGILWVNKNGYKEDHSDSIHFWAFSTNEKKWYGWLELAIWMNNYYDT